MDSISFHYTIEYPASPQQVLAFLTDRDFLKEYAVELGTTSHDAELQEEDGVRSIHLRLVAPTDQIPSVFRGLVGSEIVMDDRREWVADGNGGYRGTLHVEANIKGRLATIRGSLTLTPGPSAPARCLWLMVTRVSKWRSLVGRSGTRLTSCVRRRSKTRPRCSSVGSTEPTPHRHQPLRASRPSTPRAAGRCCCYRRPVRTCGYSRACPTTPTRTARS